MTVLQRKELESSPLADLHAIASELGLEGFRAKRKADLIGAILDAQGGAEPVDEEPEPDEVPAAEALEAPDVVDDEPDEEPSAESLEGSDEPEAESPGESELDVVEEEPEVVQDEVSDEEVLTGGLDILANGSGFLRVDPSGQSRADVYVSPAQIRRCELRAGDEVSGPVRPPRRNERHPSLVRVESVNGADAEPPEQRPWFDDLTPVFAKERLGELGGVPYGKGSRVAAPGRRRFCARSWRSSRSRTRTWACRSRSPGCGRRRSQRGARRGRRCSAAASSGRPRRRPRRPSWPWSARSARSSAASTRRS
jgi:transcription termination factor Rho